MERVRRVTDMNISKKMLFVFIIFVLALSSCVPPGEINDVPAREESKTSIELTRITDEVGRITDEEAGVVCYLYYRNSIFCLPIGETLLSR